MPCCREKVGVARGPQAEEYPNSEGRPGSLEKEATPHDLPLGYASFRRQWSRLFLD